MTQLVKLEKREPITTSEILAEGTNKTHRSVMQLIRQYENEMNEFGTLTFEMRKSKGRPTEFAILNEAQVYFLFTLFRNNDVVVEFKKRLVKEFMRMKKALLELHKEQSTIEWEKSRHQGKQIRKDVTDVIQEFVQYATLQGSKNAIRYYSNISSMENKALFILEQKYPNVRDMLNFRQLNTLQTADAIVKNALEDGMKENMQYKDIYKMAKERIEEFANLIRPTLVISYDNVRLVD